jgi:hypothetical protein
MVKFVMKKIFFISFLIFSFLSKGQVTLSGNNIFQNPPITGQFVNVVSSNTIGTVAPVTFSQSQPSNPASTTSTTAVMMGLARSITVGSSGILEIIIGGTVTNTADGDGAGFQIRYGTGTAPTNGVAVTGTQLGNIQEFVNGPLTASGLNVPFSLNGIVGGLTPGTVYWIDIALQSITGGTSAIGFMSCTIKTY